MDKKRYKIREQIGQGGMGAVFRAFDTRMNREVAIKRIRHGEGQQAEPDEAADQIIKEAGALASLQHPHIVTVYDVGTDKDGPYVVMELINGKTIDELIERAPLTWPDFKELALQTQEALIGAQDRNLVHRDLKPSNLMLTWLPSGRFQVKILDFGLAKLAEVATPGKLVEADAVYGSVLFMCPEQFERAELDARADMYSMGCVYYHALTQAYPFNGETAMQVMTAHLNHEVVPLQEVRPDLPRWVCDWVMWHINRLADDRPPNARNSLKVFLQNDTPAPTPPTSAPPTPPSPAQPRRPRPVGPGIAAAPPPSAAEPIPEPPRTQTSPQPLLPPEGSLPSIHHSPYPEPTPTDSPPPQEFADNPALPSAVVLTPAAATLLAPPSRLAIGGRPGAGPIAVPASAPSALGHRPAALGKPPAGVRRPAPQAAGPGAPNKASLSNGAKITIGILLALVVVLLVIVLLR